MQSASITRVSDRKLVVNNSSACALVNEKNVSTVTIFFCGFLRMPKRLAS